MAVGAVARVGGAKALAQCRAGPGGGAGLGQQRQLQGREIADADKARALAHGALQRLVGQLGQQAADAVAAAGGERHVRPTGRRAADGDQARGVVAGKTLEAGQRVCVDFHLMPHCLQALHATAEGSAVAHRAGRGIHVDVCHGRFLISVCQTARQRLMHLRQQLSNL